MGRRRQGEEPKEPGRIIPIRFDEVDLIAIEETVVRRNTWTRRKPWDMSKFVREAVRQLIRKMERSRAPRAKR